MKCFNLLVEAFFFALIFMSFYTYFCDMLKYLLLFITSLFCFTTFFSQKVFLDGTVSGYTYNPNNGLISKGGDISLEGTLSGVKIEFFKNGKLIKSVTSKSEGGFKYNLPFGELYEVKYSKNGYEIVRFEFDLENLNEDDKSLTFKNLELILNKHIQYKDNTDIGIAFRIYYDEKALNFAVEEKGFKIGGTLSKKMDYGPLVSLINGSIKKNEPFLFSNNKSSSSHANSENTKIIDEGMVPTDTSGIEESNLVESTTLSSKNILSKLGKNKSLDSKESLIEELKKQLEIDKLNASTPEEFALIAEREALILALSNELELSKEVIAFKEEQLSTKSKQFWLLMLVLLVVIGAGAYVYLSMRKKAELDSKIISQGNRIVASISYAEKIQTALLPSVSELQSIVPKSFLIYKPKDIVSGDFYWVKEVDGKIVIAAIDCTGHGVPGAFMSMIGMTLFNQIVLIDKILNPEIILSELQRNIASSLKQNNQDPFSSQDGMDLSIAVYDKKTSELTYAGAMNSIFMVSKGEVKELEVDKFSVGGFSFRKEDEKYANKVIKVGKGESLYLMSDGFMDQFGGDQNEKFNLDRLEKLLISIGSMPMKDQKEKVEDALRKWQGEKPQTDDILFMGVSFSD